MNRFNIFTQLKKEITQFDDDSIRIAGLKTDESNIRYAGRTNDSGYIFNQRQVINTVTLYYNSIFNSPKTDSEGQRKAFLNIGGFRADVAAKQIDIDVSDFLFIPESGNSAWVSYFTAKDFRQWAKENKFGGTINQFGDLLPRMGTVVAKKVGDTVENVNLLTLRNQQDAKDLGTATYVHETHKDMTISDMQEMKGWDLDGLDQGYGKTYTVEERYGRVPLDWYNEHKDITVDEGDHKKTIDTMSILVQEANEKEGEDGGSILFINKISKRPYKEVHWKKQEGRWLGIGEIEHQFENQLMRNQIVNLQKRAMLWGSKKLFQTRGDSLAQNLLRDVKDGQVLKVGANGEITPVNMATQALGDFSQSIEEWEDNSDKKSFTFEVTTGEALPSGTPFRLGVILTNAVQSHFAKKRENFAIFLKEITEEFVYPTFKKQNRAEHLITIFGDDEGIEDLKKAQKDFLVNKTVRDTYLSGQVPDIEAVREEVERKVEEKKFNINKIEEDYYELLPLKVFIVITGEETNIEKSIETLTNIYNTLVSQQDPRADKILNRILALTGEKPEIGKTDAPPGLGGAEGSIQTLQQAETSLEGATATPEI